MFFVCFCLFALFVCVCLFFFLQFVCLLFIFCFFFCLFVIVISCFQPQQQPAQPQQQPAQPATTTCPSTTTTCPATPSGRLCFLLVATSTSTRPLSVHSRSIPVLELNTITTRTVINREMSRKHSNHDHNHTLDVCMQLQLWTGVGSPPRQKTKKISEHSCQVVLFAFSSQVWQTELGV